MWELSKLSEELSKVENRHQVIEKKKCKKGHLSRCEGRVQRTPGDVISVESWDITVEAPYVRKRPRRKARKEGAGGETLRRIDCSFCHQERMTGKQDQGLSGDDKAG